MTFAGTKPLIMWCMSQVAVQLRASGREALRALIKQLHSSLLSTAFSQWRLISYSSQQLQQSLARRQQLNLLHGCLSCWHEVCIFKSQAAVEADQMSRGVLQALMCASLQGWQRVASRQAVVKHRLEAYQAAGSRKRLTAALMAWRSVTDRCSTLQQGIALVHRQLGQSR